MTVKNSNRDEIAACTALLEAIIDDRSLLAEVPRELRERLLMAAGRVSHPDKRAKKRLARARIKREKGARRDTDEALLAKTSIRRLRDSPIFQTPRNQRKFALNTVLNERSALSTPLGTAGDARCCYVCRQSYRDVHYFYDQMCVPCGDFNHAKRTPLADLRGRVALITGSRVKIGYQAAIMMLRSGCTVLSTTRFPADAAKRYAAELDFDEWKDRLHIFGIDLRHTPSVEQLCGHLLASFDRLDFIINNACQTVRRPPGFYDHLINAELSADGLPAVQRALIGAGHEHPAAHAGALTESSTVLPSAILSQVALLPDDAQRGNHLFPEGQLDADLQQVDLRKVNSWRLRLHEVPAVELLEVHLVNAVAPFIFNARLKPLMLNVPTRDKHIVNVSAVEGQFYRVFKTDRHPHTNMAKASLNMLTRTAAVDYEADGIHMNSVDTGWVTDEDPVHHAEAKREMHRFHPPLDIVDGAARIVDPIYAGISTEKHVWGQFLKDYHPTDW